MLIRVRPGIHKPPVPGTYRPKLVLTLIPFGAGPTGLVPWIPKIKTLASICNQLDDHLFQVDSLKCSYLIKNFSLFSTPVQYFQV